MLTISFGSGCAHFGAHERRTFLSGSMKISHHMKTASHLPLLKAFDTVDVWSLTGIGWPDWAPKLNLNQVCFFETVFQRQHWTDESKRLYFVPKISNLLQTLLSKSCFVFVFLRHHFFFGGNLVLVSWQQCQVNFYLIFALGFDPNEWCLKNGLLSGGLNPQPLSHESSALTTRPRLLALEDTI